MQIEQYEGIIVLATNRHQDLDEAMHRRYYSVAGAYLNHTYVVSIITTMYYM